MTQAPTPRYTHISGWNLVRGISVGADEPEHRSHSRMRVLEVDSYRRGGVAVGSRVRAWESWESHDGGVPAVERVGLGEYRDGGRGGAFRQVDRVVPKALTGDDFAGVSVRRRGLDPGEGRGSGQQVGQSQRIRRQSEQHKAKRDPRKDRAGLIMSRSISAPIRVLVAMLFLGIGLTASGGVIPPGSIVFVEDTGYFDDLLRAEIIRQKLPIRIVTVSANAEYILRGVLGTGSEVAFSSVELVEITRGEVVWADSATRRIGIWKFSRSPKATKVIRQIVGRLKRALK